ncbi:hypothetical protein K2173_011510 [Erythroxylum novogranatense]|uniref:AB hydrolase-1 domain-containing protein n=1 Tax=Erythroxylum novogranatense TaxID=1862640 RepID=A0AAV8TWC5_9ROSI|nr:hypothetical protein K2173_011510 [Erythroxylum novogranatense]
MECVNSTDPYTLLMTAFSLIPISHYLLTFASFFFFLFYNIFEFHFFEDAFSGFRGCSVGLTYNISSPIYEGVVSQCKVLHGRYLATPWLSSPHLQTCILNFFGRPPNFNYRRQFFHASDGGTIALDWLNNSDVASNSLDKKNAMSEEDSTPIVVVIPGLTSDSASHYIKHLAFNVAKCGYNAVVSNHRGLGGVSVTSDWFYNAGWTEDLRVVIDYLHDEYPRAPLFVVGTSIGANILVKYLGEIRERTPVAGAVAICNPWDLLIGDRFITRKVMQRLYDRALTIGLQGYAQLHEPQYSRLANWEGIKKSCSIRDFDNHATCHVGKFETVDTYYRRCSSSYYVGKVFVPLLCLSTLDDPVCTKEAIPWDECRLNPNVVLATLKHGGHLALFEGLTGSSLWWVRASIEFLGVLHSSPFMHVKKIQESGQPSIMESSIDQGPYLNIAGDGFVAAVECDQKEDDIVKDVVRDSRKLHNDMLSDIEKEEHITEHNSDSITRTSQTDEQASKFQEITAPLKRRLNHISRQNGISIRLLALIAIITSWPMVEPIFSFIIGKKLKNVLIPALLRR